MAMRDLIPRGREGSTSPSPWRGGGWDRDVGPLASFRREMDRLFDDFFRTPSASRFGEFGSTAISWPSIDVEEKGNEVVITAEMPGMTDKDVDLSLDNGMLTIRGEKKGEKSERGYSERWFGRFERQIPLPSSIDEEHCRADFQNGLLTIHLPRSREAEESRKRIPINADTRH